MQIKVNRKDILFSPDSSRVIARFNYSGDERSKEITKARRTDLWQENINGDGHECD